MNNDLRMNQEEFQEAFRAFEQVYNKLNDTAQGITSSFAPAVNSGLIKNLGQLTNQVGSIGSSISGMNTTIQKQSNEMFDYDRAMAKEAEAIEIPTDFLKENSTKVNIFNQAVVDKMDGKSVNLAVGSKPVEIDEAVAVSTSTKEGLFDLSGKQTKEEQYVEKRGSQTALGDITKDSDLSDKDYRTKTGVKEGNLQDITGNKDLDDKKFSESTVTRKEMGNISKDSDTTQKEIDEVVNIRNQGMGQLKQGDGNVNANIGFPQGMNPAMSQGMQSGQSGGMSQGGPAMSSSSSNEELEKSTTLSAMMLEQERQKALKEKMQEDELEKIDYNDFNQ